MGPTAKDSKHKAYDRLKELHAEADAATYAWNSSGKSTEWAHNVRAALRRLFGNECEHVKAFNAVRYGPMMYSGSTPDHVFQDAFMRGIKRAQAIIRSAIQEFEDYDTTDRGSANRTDSAAQQAATATDSHRIFVVHGHDNEMKQVVARFLEHLGFEAVILHERASGGDTIIEKFERHSDVSYAVVLLSPDDVGGAKKTADELQPRARQNVILELGYFVGRLAVR